MRQTIMPKGGDEAVIASNSQTLIGFLAEDHTSPTFSVFDVIWREIQETSWDTKKNLTHAPYIMAMIEVVTKTRFGTDCTHLPYHPKIITVVQPEDIDDAAESSGEPDPEPVRNPSASRATSASRPFTRSQASRGRGRRGGLAGLIVRGFQSMFHMCRTSSVRTEAFIERQRIREENTERESRGEELLPVPALVPPRSPIQASIEDYQLQRFGVPFYTDSDFMPYDPPPYSRAPPPAAADFPSSSQAPPPPPANPQDPSSQVPPPPPPYEPYDFFSGLPDITEYGGFGGYGGDGAGPSGGRSAYGGSYRPF